MSVLFPTIIPQQERSRFVTEIDRRVEDRLNIALNKWKTRGPKSGHQLMQTLLAYVGQAVRLSSRMCREWFCKNKPAMSEVRFAMSEREVTAAGEYWASRAQGIFDRHKQIISGDKTTCRSAKHRIAQEASTWTDAWLQELCAWSEGKLIQSLATGTSGAGKAGKTAKEQGPFTTVDCAESFHVSVGTWRNWAKGCACPRGLNIRNCGRGRWYYRNEAQISATKHNS